MGILIIDPDTSLLKGSALSLEAEFVDVRTISHPMKAISLLRQAHFQVILTEIRFSVMDSVDFIRTVRSISPSSHIIVWSAHIGEDVRLALERVGVREFFEKPVSMWVLCARIRELIRNGHGDEAK